MIVSLEEYVQRVSELTGLGGDGEVERKHRQQLLSNLRDTLRRTIDPLLGERSRARYAELFARGDDVEAEKYLMGFVPNYLGIVAKVLDDSWEGNKRMLGR